MPEPTRSRVCKTTKDSAALFAPSKRLCIPIERAEYDRILADPVAFRAHLDGQIAAHPELFPAAIRCVKLKGVAFQSPIWKAW